MYLFFSSTPLGYYQHFLQTQAYGQSIGDKKLTRTALQTELISLAVCVVTGMACGVCMAPFEVASTWPTSEMLSRSTLTNLYFGIPIAFFSGLGVAVSLLDDQTSSLVGVAISASLLPPAVNAGLLFINAFIYEREQFTDPDYDKEFFYKGGAISFGLTLVNIVLVRVKVNSASGLTIDVIGFISRSNKQYLTPFRFP